MLQVSSVFITAFAVDILQSVRDLPLKMLQNEIQSFLVGFLVTSLVILIPSCLFNTAVKYRKLMHDVESECEKIDRARHNETMSKFLYDEVKVLCMVMTHPNNHKTLAIPVKQTWGKRCNKLLFMTSMDDSDIDTVVLPVEESRDNLEQKTKLAFKYAHDHHIDDFDFFMKADDDK